MKISLSRRSVLRCFAATLTAAATMGASLLNASAAQAQGAVFTSTNNAGANCVVMFLRSTTGVLSPAACYYTGGTGTGAGLGNQGAVALSPDNRFLFVVNAGSNDISVFSVSSTSLLFRNRVASGGVRPVSLTTYGNMLYVLNAGSDSIQGFTVGTAGSLTPIPGSLQSMSGNNTGPAQISFDPYGQLLVVTERLGNFLNVYQVDANGAAQPGVRYTSLGAVPFGFAFDPQGRVFVSEAAGASLSSYFVSSFGFLPITASVSTAQAAPCWVAVTRDGKFAYTGNAGMSRSITGFKIEKNGKATFNGIVATGLNGCTDLATEPSGKFLFALENAGGSVSSFMIKTDGTLTPVGSFGGLGAGFTGLAAR